ncbi:MAG: polyprenyl synthetase family protein [Bacteroidales bacterium]|jgi:geranylgeranyl diphosphate synthase type II|nr:polyprenyl synthetase family protein [Bacteroidales bacterium]MCU0408556.1 polyprenyl synthetase family protein [Bacteroidales bacterium]
MYTQSELKQLVDKAIGNLTYNGEAARLIDPVRYVLSIGGKRIRPVLALMACNLFSDTIDDAVMPAVGIEVFHNFTLVHDDIMDQAPVRRNYPTVHTKWNLNQAVLSGDVMAFIANDCFLQAPPAQLVEMFRTFNRTAIEVCVGQQLDIDFETAKIISQAEYIRMIELKTAVLLAAAAKIGGIAGGAAAKDAQLLYEFGRNLGLGFQIQDDILDTFGDTKVFGKATGGDIVSNKKTFLLVKAMELAPAKTRKKLQELADLKEFDPEEKVKAVMNVYEQLKVKSVTESIANDYINIAFGKLDKVSANRKRKGEITGLAESLIGRVK